MSDLFIPVIDPDDDPLTAALAYAAAGGYVLPTRPGSKHPGSRVGPQWHDKSSRCPQQLAAWFAGTNDGIALHVGRSGAVAFDVDQPDRIPAVLADAITAEQPPHQSTRTHTPGRGHYMFRQPPGRRLGNGTGKLGHGWGEIRGRNGIIVVAPSRHAHPDGRYEWLQTGIVPALPEAVAALLTDAAAADDAATDAEVAAFLEAHTDATRPALLRAVTTTWKKWLADGKARHTAAVDATVWGLKEAAAGLYPARDVVDQVRELFLGSVTNARAGSSRPPGDPLAADEYRGIVAWSVAQALAADPERTRSEVNERAPETHGQNGQNRGNGPDREGSDHFGHRIGEPWDDEPIPLARQPPPIPVNALGSVLEPLVTATAIAYQVPSDLVVNLALPLVTTAARGRWIVEVTPGWTETVSLATVSALASGERKSPVLRLLSAPLRDHEREAQTEARPRVAEQIAKRQLAEDRADKLRKDALKKNDVISDQMYLDACKSLAETTVEPLPRWLVDDVTPEGLDRLLGQHGSVGVISAEPGLFGILAGRYSNGSPNVENVLKATSGDPIRVDRAGRDPVHVETPALSLSMCIQPGRLSELGRERVFRDSGFLARLCYALPEPRVGTRSISPEPVPDAVATEWGEKLRGLAAAATKRPAGEPVRLKVDPDALGELNAYRTTLEPLLHPHHGMLAGIADWGAKLPGTIVRIAAALTLLADPSSESIRVETMRDAVQIGHAYTGHALAAFGMIHAADDGLQRAREVLGWLRKNGAPVVSLRDVYRALRGRAWVTKADDLRAALGVLAENGHVRPLVDDRETGQPGRPSEKYELHPSHRDAS